MHRDITDDDVDAVIQAFLDVADQAINAATSGAIVINNVSSTTTKQINKILTSSTVSASSTTGVSGAEGRTIAPMIGPSPTIRDGGGDGGGGGNSDGEGGGSMSVKAALAPVSAILSTATTSTTSSGAPSLHVSAIAGSTISGIASAGAGTGASAMGALIDAQPTIIDARRSSKNQNNTQPPPRQPPQPPPRQPPQPPPLNINIEEKRAQEGWMNQESNEDAEESVEFVVPGDTTKPLILSRCMILPPHHMSILWLCLLVAVVCCCAVKLSPLRSLSTTINNKLRPKSVGRARVNTGRCHPLLILIYPHYTLITHPLNTHL